MTPNYPQTTPFSIYSIAFYIFVVGGKLEIETSNLVDRLIVASASPWITNHPEKSAVMSCEPLKYAPQLALFFTQ